MLTVNTWIGRKVRERSQEGGDPLIRLTSSDIRRAGVERVPRMEGVVDGRPRLENGRALDVAAVIWATGFRPDFSWINLPELVFDEDGHPIHDRGVAEGYPGLYFLGLPFQRTVASATIGGVGGDARYIADRLLASETSQNMADHPSVGENAMERPFGHQTK